MIIGHKPKSRVKLTPPLPHFSLSPYYTRRITFFFIFRIPLTSRGGTAGPGTRKKGLYYYILPLINGTIMVFEGLVTDGITAFPHYYRYKITFRNVHNI